MPNPESWLLVVKPKPDIALKAAMMLRAPTVKVIDSDPERGAEAPSFAPTVLADSYGLQLKRASMIARFLAALLCKNRLAGFPGY